MNFKEPITTFSYNLISLHHDIIWYIILIITVVYWSLFKVLKEFIWRNSNKQGGFFNIVYKTTLIYKIQSFILFLWLNIFFKILQYIFIYLIKTTEKVRFLILENNTSIIKKLYIFFLGKSVYEGNILPSYFYNINYKNIENIFIDKYLSYYLFNVTSNGLFYYDGYDNFLLTHQFKHSINLEYVFGFFPTIIIGLIIAPSMYLLYSNEAEINPGLTIKIIGHQWFWSYESSNINCVTNDNRLLLVDYNYDSVIISEEDLILGGKRLLETDNSLVLPYNIALKLLIHLQMFCIHELYQN